MSTIPVDIPKIEQLTREFSDRLKDITGRQPNIDVWFHSCDGDTRPLAHDAVVCGYRVKRIRDHYRPHTWSHIRVNKSIPDVGNIIIVVSPRTRQ